LVTRFEEEWGVARGCINSILHVEMNLGEHLDPARLIAIDIRKLCERSHTRIRTLTEWHSVRALTLGSREVNLSMANLGDSRANLRSAVTEAWANSELCTRDLDWENEPERRLLDTLSERVEWDLTPCPAKGEEKAAKAARAEHISSVYREAALESTTALAVVCDGSVPNRWYQAVAAWSLAWAGSTRRDWQA
jgi:hypothetical protein